ncbi:hypothetical protein BSKO_05435 [Bryopsis sp. KO-2023]|nr:hypothetical protein BSKO_05435 [Bryopsis sp. KO-2023]
MRSHRFGECEGDARLAGIPLPDLNEPSMAGLGKGLVLAERVEKGRHVVADREFPAGAVVLSQAPYQAVLHADHVTRRCSYCLAPSDSLMRCGRSKFAKYCSKEHQRLDWGSGYKEECEALRRCAPRIPTPTIRLLARVLWKKVRASSTEDNPLSEWSSFEKIDGLLHHWEKLSDERKQTFTQMAVVTREYMYGLSSEVENGVSVKEIAFLLAKFACNNHTICDEELRVIGVGIYPLLCMVNHSCAPNCIQVFRGRKLEFRALHKISPGDEITISYVDLMATRFERRQQLLSNYHFDIDLSTHSQDSHPPQKVFSIDPHTKLRIFEGKGAPHRQDTIDQLLTGVEISSGGNECRGYGVAIREGGCQEGLCGDDANSTGFLEIHMWGGWEQRWGRAELKSMASKLSHWARLFLEAERMAKGGDMSVGVVALERVYRDSMENLSENVSLGDKHLFRCRVGLGLLKCAIDEGKNWKLALEVARDLAPVFEMVYSGGSPNLGLHLAGLAKMEVFCGDAEKGLLAAEKAMDVLKIAHSDLPVMEEVRRIRYECEQELRS